MAGVPFDQRAEATSAATFNEAMNPMNSLALIATGHGAPGASSSSALLATSTKPPPTMNSTLMLPPLIPEMSALPSGYYNVGNAMAATLLAQSKCTTYKSSIVVVEVLISSLHHIVF